MEQGRNPASSVTEPISRRHLLMGALAAKPQDNPRFEFLRTNLQVFPGTDKLFVPDERLFWRLRSKLKDIRAAERLPGVEYPFIVSTDAKGRRSIPQRPGTRRRILFLGDSCTFGIPVNDGESFPALVQQALSGTECLNAGVPGYSTFQGRLLLEGTSERLDVIVITFWPNDRSVWDQLGDYEHQELLRAERENSFSRYRYLRILRRAAPTDRPRLSAAEFEEQIRLLVRLSRDRGAKPVIQIWPARQQVEGMGETDHQEVLRRVSKTEGVMLVDLLPVFRAAKSRGLFVDSIHASRAGYALAAEALVRVLE
jgi:lysophospholipase L1-like esterase